MTNTALHAENSNPKDRGPSFKEFTLALRTQKHKLTMIEDCDWHIMEEAWMPREQRLGYKEVMWAEETQRSLA